MSDTIHDISIDTAYASGQLARTDAALRDEYAQLAQLSRARDAARRAADAISRMLDAEADLLGIN